MPVEEAPNDDDVRQSYNFAPGYHGLVYRSGGLGHDTHVEKEDENGENINEEGVTETKYKLQSMQWGRCRKLLFGEVLADANLLRPCTFLDEAQSRLRFQDEDYQLP